MGCCCSCCCCKPDVEASQDYRLSQDPTRAKTPSITNVPATFDTQSIPDDEPPPYEQESTQPGPSTASRLPKDLPYIIPLTSATTPEDSLAAAYAEELQCAIRKEDYIEFLAGLDRGLFASPTAEPGTASAYIQSMFQDSGWQTSAGAAQRSAGYLTAKNASLFNPAKLQVDILTTDQMKSRIDAASQAELARQENAGPANQGKQSREALKIQQRLLTAKTFDKQQKAMQKYLEKDDKYSRGARSGADRAAGTGTTASFDGIYWLLVSKY